MGRSEVLQKLRLRKFEAVMERWHKRALRQAEAAEILGMSERTSRRWRGRHEDAGLEGLYDRRIGRASAQRVAVDRSRPTQVGRALAQLGIEHIAAYSPSPRPSPAPPSRRTPAGRRATSYASSTSARSATTTPFMCCEDRST